MADARRPTRPVARRAFLVGGLVTLGGVVSACARTASEAPVQPTGPSASPPARPVPPVTPEPAPSPPPVALPPDVPGYVVLPGEVEPACKQAAVDYVTAAMTAGTASTAGVALAARLEALGQPVEPAAPLTGMLPSAGASLVEVVYPQYGGLTKRADVASVMLVADQLLVPVSPAGAQPAVERRSLTVDVRLKKADGRWTVTDVLPAEPGASGPSASSSVQSLLTNPQVVMPAAARADLLSGAVHDAVADALNALSQRWQMHVQVLVSGHPYNVFATDKVSNHTRGRAVDVWALDGVPVIDQQRCAWREAMQAAAAAGASEVGGPAVVGPAGSFSDQVHQDHLHLGFGRA